MNRCQWFTFGIMLMIASISFFTLARGFQTTPSPMPDVATVEDMILWSTGAIKSGIYGSFGIVLFFLSIAFLIGGFLEKKIS